MSDYLGDFVEDAVVPLGDFTTNDRQGGRSNMSGVPTQGDFAIYSSDGDGTYTLMTLDASTIIITGNPESKVGVYLVSVDMSNDADFVTGKDYVCVLYPDETIDGQSVAEGIGHWSCQNRYITRAAINAEVVDALAIDTYAEPGQGAPAATTTLAAKINYLYKAWRNKKEQTATTLSIYDDAGTTVDQKATVSDDATTATKGEIVSGP